MPEDERNQRLVGEMLSDIRHLQSDVTDIKAEQRIRFDKVDERFEKVDERFDKVDARFEKVDERFDKLEAKFDARFEKVDERFGKIDERFESLSKEISGIRVSLASATVWAITLYMALAGTMLYVMARGFKWL